MRRGMAFRLSATLLAVCLLGAAVVTGSLAAVRPGAEYVVLVDCTGTMRYAGRGAATLAVLESFLESLNEGDRVTVYGYGEEPFPALPDYPVTIDSPAAGAAIAGELRLPFAANRTDITRGLELAWQERGRVFSRALSAGSTAPGGSACVILLTDGKLVPVYDDYAQYDEIYHESRARLRQLGRLFADAGISIYSVGLGKAEKVDGKLLTQVSESSGGFYCHAATSDDLMRVFASLMDGVIAAAAVPVEVGGAEAPMVAMTDGDKTLTVAEDASVSEQEQWNSLLGGIVEEASAAGRGQTSRVEAAFSQSFGDLGSQVYQGIIGVLGVMIGFVAIGVHRRQSWTNVFTKELLRREIRVKGYLRRVVPDGVIAALSNIAIENPGLPAIEVGAGTCYAEELRETLMEFAGTADGSPPILRVLKGSVQVAGELVDDARVLVDGDIIECEGKAYKYLRGQRR